VGSFTRNEELVFAQYFIVWLADIGYSANGVSQGRQAPKPMPTTAYSSLEVSGNGLPGYQGAADELANKLDEQLRTERPKSPIKSQMTELHLCKVGVDQCEN
jgi:hypothetical protein